MNIVFASVDCLRPDATSHRFFDSLAARGREYDTCIVQAPFTSPSHTSMLTGKYPFEHGVRWLIDYNNEACTLPEVFQAAGFNTAGFTGGYPLPTGNLDEGFDTWEHHDTCEDQMEGRQKFGPANFLVNRAINWLNEHKGEDNFVFLHFFDLHLTLRSEFGKRDPPDFDDQHVYENVEQYLGRQQRRYYEEADFVARQLKLLHDLVEVDATVVTGDHGSKMPGEHGYPWVYNSKGRRVGSQFRAVELYEELVRVPFYLAGDPIDAAPTVHEMVRSIDIAPTLLDALDIVDPAGEFDPTGQSVLEGLPEFNYMETYHGQLTQENKLTHRMNERYDFGWSEIDSLVGVRTNEWKLICTANGSFEPSELYHIAQDPGEHRNLIDDHPDIVENLYKHIEKWVSDDPQPYRTADEVDEDVRNHLNNLGYL